jgi:hypothetical protein
MNTVTITGRFTADPELKITSGAGQGRHHREGGHQRAGTGQGGLHRPPVLGEDSRVHRQLRHQGPPLRGHRPPGARPVDRHRRSQHSKHYLVTGPYQFRFLDKSSDTDEPEAPAEDG